MRVTLKLNDFFQDHRSVAKVFVNEKIKCIGDLEKHISSIFNIHNFYLAWENGEYQFLPPSEDIRILNYDDVIRAVPLDSCEVPNSNHTCQVDEGSGTVPPVKKKKKKKNEEPKEQSNTEVNGTSKKKRKSKYSETREKNVSSNLENGLSSEPRKKSKKKSLIDSLSSYHDECPETKEDNLGASLKNNSSNGYQNKLNEKSLVAVDLRNELKEYDTSDQEDLKDKKNSQKKVKEIVTSFEKKGFNKMPDPSKKINIIKTIIISGGPSAPPEIEHTTTVPNNEKSLIDVVKKTDATLKGDTTFHVSEASESVESITARKRKRKRKRAVKDRPSVEAIKKTNAIPNGYPRTWKPITPNCSWNSEGATPILPRPQRYHIRFKDEARSPDSTAIGNTETQEETVREDSEDKCVDQTNMVVPDTKDEGTNGGEKQLQSDPQINEMLILESPVISNLLPKVGDVIGFKYLRISENYTPEISSHIVGKVLNFNPDTRSVNFNIVYGLEQCLEPQGKFFIDPDDENFEEKTEREFNWSNLLEPRLLSWL